MKGLAFSTTNGSDIALPYTQTEILSAKNSGSNWISLAIRLFLESKSASLVTTYAETPSDEEIDTFLNTADQANMKVMFKIILHP